jgi:PAS domain S-box-containing protein
MRTTTILIVEDEALIAEEIRDCLEHIGHTVVGIVDTSDAAVAAVRETPPGLVLMDVCLKGEGDGVEAAWLIGEHTRVPVVFITAHSDHETLDRALLTRPFGYVLKPVREAELASAVQAALLRAAAAARLREGDARQQQSIEQSADLLLRVSADGHVVAANPAFRTALGYTPAQLAKMWLIDLVPEQDRTALYNAAVRPQREAPAAPFRVALIKNDGEVISVNVILSHPYARHEKQDLWLLFEPSSI